MVTVVSTPQGHKIIDQAIDAFIGDASGDAVVVFDYHSLTTGDYIYVTSDIDEYNGFWYVEVASYREFQLREHADADLVEYYQDADIEYYRTQPHDWSSIFLPIVYKITNDRWPINSSDTARTVSSASDDNGFTQLDVSGFLKGQVNILEFVKITGATDDDLNNIWQIVEVISTSSIVINLPYSVDNSFSGALVQYYYNNYQVRVKVWAGLVSHPWESKKPYEEMAELSLTPDEDNEVMFSISDYIKSKVQVKNNLTLFSLPLNLDAFTGFYIQTAESYDYSDNYALYIHQDDFITNLFEGYAVAGKLPFKNTYSGDYADYVYTSGSPAQWLTNASRLLAVEDLYFDISFIKNIEGTFNLIINKYIADSINTTQSIAYADNGIGVYRIPITVDTAFDSFCVHIETDTHEEEQETIVTTDFDLSLWLNDTQPGLLDWTIGIANPTANVVGANTQFLYDDYATVSGQTYRYEYEFSAANTDPGTKTYQLLFLDAGFLAVGFSFINIPGDGTYSGSVDITPSSNGTYIALKVSSIGVQMDITAIRVSVISIVTETVEVEGAVITEEICIDILETCEAQQGFSEEDRRLLEDGDFRLLE
jgi:hypothetical protein